MNASQAKKFGKPKREIISQKRVFLPIKFIKNAYIQYIRAKYYCEALYIAAS